ncbi:hypothetical protein EG833_00360, partial [archaeon]|nr:hypothetical protein [archaeon]
MQLIDVHVHLFPEDILDGYMEDYTAHSGLQAACRPTVHQLFEEYDGVDVKKFVILQEWESTKKFDSENLIPAAESDHFYTRCYFYYFNKWLGRIQKEHGNIICFGGVHPSDPGCRDEFEMMIQDYGLKGMKLVPCMQHFFLNDRRLFPVYEQAEARGIPLLVHTGGDPVPGTEIFGHPRDVDEIAQAFPRLRIILAHMGIPFFEETREILKKHPNTCTDIAFTVSFDDVHAFSRHHRIDAPFLTRDFWRETVSSLVREFGYERI